MRASLTTLLFLVTLTITGYGAPVLETDLVTVNFGKAPQNSNLYHKLVLKSVGDQPVVITKIDTYCKCISIPLKDSVIAPGDSIITEVSLFTAKHVGAKLWQPHIYIKGGKETTRFRVKATIVGGIEKSPICASPHTVTASQFGDNIVNEVPINLINKSEENIPLKLIYTDNEFYTLEFPTYIPPNDTAVGRLILNELGLKSNFEKTIIFEYIDDKSEKILYSIPTRRKIYK